MDESFFLARLEGITKKLGLHWEVKPNGAIRTGVMCPLNVVAVEDHNVGSLSLGVAIQALGMDRDLGARIALAVDSTHTKETVLREKVAAACGIILAP